ncbi:hypothetical protein OGAPHI_006396 [Ogataea philodendri]|uniref:Alpha/beta hydrolase fold-3 domain-containing protein n=1 Tax=Ogataea philodendri TaxID=1378263 RepID=A0A9P8T097_9ASCO|nr:uncharacterized protein OGAPHI_006396 [Ogataea philodendri]KAH3661548.1 hypothetical protein OGAPHI_006396 [Ogataea philodendri]
MFSNYSIGQNISFWVDNWGFCELIHEPLNNKNKVHRQGTLHQFVLLRLLKQLVPEVTNEAAPGYSFAANAVWKRFYDYRSIFQAWNGIELSTYEELKKDDVKGVLIKKAECSDKTVLEPDLAIYYIPNLAILANSPHFYTEYLTTLHSLLLLQGFKNPVILIAQMKSPSKAEFPDQLLTLLHGWKYITDSYPKAKCFIAGDSAGASLALSFLIFRSAPDSSIFTKPEEESDENLEQKNATISSITENHIPPPFGAIIISPILKFRGVTERPSEDQCPDFLTSSFINRISQNYIPPNLPDLEALHSPGFCNNSNKWEQSFPEKGIILTWGAEELLNNEIEEFGNILAMAGATKRWKVKSAVHSWPFVSFLTEDAQDEKEDSCFIFAGIISRMALWHSAYYLDPNSSKEPMNLLTIDDDHL